MAATHLSQLLHQYAGISGITPLWNNILSALLTVAYLKGAHYLVARRGLAEEFVHVATGCLLIFWPLFDVSHETWRLNVLVPAALLVRLVHKGLNKSTSTSSPDLMYGPLQFAVIMIWVGLFRFMTTEGVIIMAAVGVGDGIAPWVSRHYGQHKYRLPWGTQKSLEGSLGVFLGTIVGCYCMLYVCGLSMLPLKTLAQYGVVAAVVEGSSPGKADNILISLAMHYCLAKVPSMSTSSSVF